MEIKIPDDAIYILNAIEAAGYEANVVGGCVRDALLGKAPDDWDICTSALPEQTMEIFYNHHIIETGLQHGTVTLMLHKKPYEITTYRVDGKYKDNRRPEQVKFVSVLKRDLARRDFTINAMAYNPKTGLADYYGGRQDLADKIIKCVGNPDKRFGEDALRIMRAMRFAAALGFKIDGGTKQAMLENKALLNNIAKERIAAELNKLIVGDGAAEIILEHFAVISEVIPELTELHDFSRAPKDIGVRLAVLFNGTDSETAVKILRRLKYDNATAATVKTLVLYRGADIQPESKNIKRWLNKIGEETLRKLLEVKRAGNTAQLDNITSVLNEIIEQNQCFSLKNLAVGGNDLISIGITEGTKIGGILKRLLDIVIDEQIENEKTILLETAKKLLYK